MVSMDPKIDNIDDNDVQVVEDHYPSLSPKILKSNTPTQSFEEPMNMNIDMESSGDQAPMIRPRQLGVREEKPRVRQPVSEKIAQLQSRITDLEVRNGDLEMENGAFASELEDAESEINRLRELLSDQEGNRGSDGDDEYISHLLSAAGFASHVEGQELSLPDRVVLMSNQYQTATSALSYIKTELMSLAHQLHKNKQKALANQVMRVLESASKMGNVVIISEISDSN